MFGFRNPGLMRVPREIALQGGESDCRNRILHQLFRYVGLGEQAGSGIPKIYQGWDSRHWRTPRLIEKEEPSDQTLLELSMLGLLPESVINTLRARFGPEFDALPNLERLILATAASEGTVTHRRMGEITTDHAYDLTRAFQHLCRMQWLQSKGRTRATVYFLPGTQVPIPESAFTEAGPADSGQYSTRSAPDSAHLSDSSAHLNDGSAHLNDDSAHLSDGSAHLSNTGGEARRMPQSRLTAEDLDRPLIDRFESLDQETARELLQISAESREKKKIAKARMEAVILEICTARYITLHVLEYVLQRKAAVLRQNYLRPMVADGKLRMAYPTAPTSPKQAYIAADAG